MEELCVEGLATHGDPGTCVDDPRGRGEALTGVRAGRVIEPRNTLDWGADAVDRSGRPHRQERYRELLADPARSKTPCMRGISVRENREVPYPPAWVIAGRAAQGTPRR